MQSQLEKEKENQTGSDQALLSQPGDLAPSPPQTAQPRASHRPITSPGFPSTSYSSHAVAKQCHNAEDDTAESLALVPVRKDTQIPNFPIHLSLYNLRTEPLLQCVLTLCLSP